MTAVGCDNELLTVLVLAGGNLTGKALGPAPQLWSHPLLLPAGSGIAFHQITRFYQQGSLPTLVLVLVDSDPPPEVPIRGLRPEQLVRIPPQSNILGSLRAGLASISTPWVLINPITTLPCHPAEQACQILVGEQPLIREDWSALRHLPDNGWRFEGKNDASSTEEPTFPFTGILSGPTDVLAQLAAALPDSCGSDMLALGEQLFQHAGATIVHSPWHDLGHRTTHAASRRCQLPSRAFNTIEHCQRRDVIVKRSLDVTRLRAEKSYIENLPITLRRYFPSLLPSHSGEEEALVMEAIPFPSLAELYLHWELGPNTWLTVLERLATIQADLAGSDPPISGSSCWLYSGKLTKRWEQFQSLQAARHSQRKSLDISWWDRELCINGCWLPPLSVQIDSLLNRLVSLEDPSLLHRIHGDLCFNNVLCDPMYCAVRLIDPRGEPAPTGNLPIGFGDSRYDSVKLYHSIGGHYDAIVNDLFRLSWFGSQQLDLEVYIPPNQPFLDHSFRELLMPPGLSNNDLLVLTSSLFFSMLPLHYEDDERLVALAARGMLLFEAANL